MGLSNEQQAVVMFLVFVLPALITWMALGFPTDRMALGILGAALASGFLAFLKEILGGKAPASGSSTSPPSANTPTQARRLPSLNLKRRQMFLEHLR